MTKDLCEILIILTLIPLVIAGMHTLLERPQAQPSAKPRAK